jgi:hypothetical protein
MKIKTLILLTSLSASAYAGDLDEWRYRFQQQLYQNQQRMEDERLMMEMQRQRNELNYQRQLLEERRINRDYFHIDFDNE